MGHPSLLVPLFLSLFILPQIAMANREKHKHIAPHHHPYDPEASAEELRSDYYERTCPSFRAVVYQRVSHWLEEDPTLGPSLVRLLFHDCGIRGCDASILLDYPGSEKHARSSKTLRGFEVIDDIKKHLEEKCPRTVSCADILVAASQSATEKVGGPYWPTRYGRKDGKVSKAAEVDALLPTGYNNVTYLIEFFDSLGLNLLDLVVLSGAHTIGRCSCASIHDRLYNYKGVKGSSDPSIHPKYLNYLKRKCRWADEYVYLDATTPYKFDDAYYKNLERHMGLLKTDQILYSDSRTGPIITALASEPIIFMQQFAVSMTNLADTLVLVGEEGGVRTDCRYVNSVA